MGMGGTQRSAKFAKYLVEFGWNPIVLTVKDVNYYAIDESLLGDVANREIIRTESLDPLRILARLRKQGDKSGRNSKADSSKGHSKISSFLNKVISGWLLIPDSKILWLPFLIPGAIRQIKKHKIKVVYTTSPPHSAHLGGVILRILTKVKLVADFRDDWTGGESQPSPSLFHDFINRLMEKIVLKKADVVLSMCESLTANLQRKSGDNFNTSKFRTITNGYDAEDFSALLDLPMEEKFTITHCGSISRVSNPDPFLQAVQKLFHEYPELKGKVQIQFFGTDLFGDLQAMLNQYSLHSFIQPIKYLPHKQALKKVMKSHLLLLTIFKKTNEEIITSKVFEYFASGKPILLVSGEGEVARQIKFMKRGKVIPNDNIDSIKEAILEYYQKFKNKQLKFEKPLSTKQFDRAILTKELAETFSDVVKQGED